jgi:hypothetical protein
MSIRSREVNIEHVETLFEYDRVAAAKLGRGRAAKFNCSFKVSSPVVRLSSLFPSSSSLTLLFSCYARAFFLILFAILPVNLETLMPMN